MFEMRDVSAIYKLNQSNGMPGINKSICLFDEMNFIGVLRSKDSVYRYYNFGKNSEKSIILNVKYK